MRLAGTTTWRPSTRAARQALYRVIVTRGVSVWISTALIVLPDPSRPPVPAGACSASWRPCRWWAAWPAFSPRRMPRPRTGASDGRSGTSSARTPAIASRAANRRARGRCAPGGVSRSRTARPAARRWTAARAIAPRPVGSVSPVRARLVRRGPASRKRPALRVAMRPPAAAAPSTPGAVATGQEPVRQPTRSPARPTPSVMATPAPPHVSVMATAWRARSVTAGNASGIYRLARRAPTTGNAPPASA